VFDRESINLVLSDQMMPGMFGTELTKSVKAMRPTMPVVLCRVVVVEDCDLSVVFDGVLGVAGSLVGDA
jgi:CheY-like chemotaxis protein